MIIYNVPSKPSQADQVSLKTWKKIWLQDDAIDQSESSICKEPILSENFRH